MRNKVSVYHSFELRKSENCDQQKMFKNLKVSVGVSSSLIGSQRLSALRRGITAQPAFFKLFVRIKKILFANYDIDIILSDSLEIRCLVRGTSIQKILNRIMSFRSDQPDLKNSRLRKTQLPGNPEFTRTLALGKYTLIQVQIQMHKDGQINLILF